MQNEADDLLKQRRIIQLSEIELIRLFVDICEKEKLTYYMIGGTMLGAIRHKGYIPWDDDADFGMPRPDYEKFFSVADKYMPPYYETVTFLKKEEFPLNVGQLVDLRTEVEINWAAKSRVGHIWIDIFPLDGMPNNCLLRRMHLIHLLYRRMMFVLASFDRIAFLNKKNRPWYEKILMFCAMHVPIQNWLSSSRQYMLFDRALKSCSYEKSRFLINMIGAYKSKEMFPKVIFGKGRMYEFEGMMLNGPQDYETYLTQIYGDYMTPPPETERNKHETELLQGK